MDKKIFPSVIERTIKPSELKDYESKGWKFSKEISSSAYSIRKKLNKWEKFEVKLRYLFKSLDLQDHIEDYKNFNYRELGPQIDACGGIDRYFILVDCTTKQEFGGKSLREKIKDFRNKKSRLIENIKNKYGQKYLEILYVICTQDVKISKGDMQFANKNKIYLIDYSFFEKCFAYKAVLGKSIKYQIIKRLLGKNCTINDEALEKDYKLPALKIGSGRRILYNFTIDPETLHKLAYIYRLELAYEKGYQRDLMHSKLVKINEFLNDRNNYFPNNIIVCFDSKIKFIEDPKVSLQLPGVKYGTLIIPKYYCSAEVIDGQHRLYGYYDITPEGFYDNILKQRQKEDRLSVIAICEPTDEERPILFIDINTTQTKIKTVHIWSIMRNIRPNSYMGYIANIISALNERGFFKDKIYIPGETYSTLPMNIANLGDALKKRNLLNKEGRFVWNLFDGDRTSKSYPETATIKPITDINKYFETIKKFFSKSDWQRLEDIIVSNIGVSVIFNILSKVLKYSHEKKLSFNRHNIRALLRRPLLDYFFSDQALRQKRIKKFKKFASSEAGRTEVVEEITKLVRKNRKFSDFP